jgi:hypothetical protein
MMFTYICKAVTAGLPTNDAIRLLDDWRRCQIQHIHPLPGVKAAYADSRRLKDRRIVASLVRLGVEAMNDDPGRG